MNDPKNIPMSNEMIGIESTNVKRRRSKHVNFDDNVELIEREDVMSIDEIEEEFDVSTKFYFFYGSNGRNQSFELYEWSNITAHKMYDKNRLTVLYLHGTLESISSEGTKLLIDAYNTRNDHNIIILNWEKIAIPFEGNDKLVKVLARF